MLILLRRILAATVFVCSATLVYAQAAQDLSQVQIKPTRITDKFYTLEGQGGMIGVLF